MKKYFIYLLTFLIIISSGIISFAGDDGKWEIAAFRMGNGNDKDARAFIDGMKLLGYNKVYFKTNNSTDKDKIPKAKTVRDVTRTVDYALISGHGWRYADMPVYKNVNDSTPYEFFCAEKDAAFNNSDVDRTKPIYEIGAKFLRGSTTVTESCFNDDLEWAIFTGCNQLNYLGEGDGKVWQNMNCSQIWGRTLLANTNRAHGILGYHYKAPESPYDVDVMENFMLYSASQQSMIRAWQYANEGVVDWNWAAICHRALSEDKIGVYTADPSTSSKVIDWYGNNLPYRKYLDIEGNEITPDYSYTSRSGMPQIKPTNLMALGNKNFFLRAASLNKNTRVVEKDNKRFSFDISDAATGFNSVKKSREIVDEKAKEELVAKLLRTNNQKNYRKKNWDYYKNGAKTLKLSDNGDLEYIDSSVTLSEGNVNISEKDAVKKAKDSLRDLDLLPSDKYSVYISSVQRYPMIFDEDDTITLEPDIVEYTVKFVHNFDGKEMFSKDDEGIVVSINKNGISRIKKTWSKVSYNNTIKLNDSNGNIIWVNEAIETFTTNYEKLFNNTDDTENVIVDEVDGAYYLFNGDVIPVWMFAFDGYKSKVFINAHTGELIH